MLLSSGSTTKTSDLINVMKKWREVNNITIVVETSELMNMKLYHLNKDN